MWKKNNPKASKTEVRPQDRSSLHGVRPSLSTQQKVHAAPVSSDAQQTPASSPLGATLQRLRGTHSADKSPQAKQATPPTHTAQTAQSVLPGSTTPAKDTAQQVYNLSGSNDAWFGNSSPDIEPQPPEVEAQTFIVFTGQGGEYLWLMVKTIVCSLFTLGVYSFWGRCDMRRYLWSNTYMLGEPLEYTGTGKELFIGFLIVMPFMIALSCLVLFVGADNPLAGSVVLYGAALLCYEYATYRALRYRLTRTRWRGIRANLDGHPAAYAAKATALWTLAVLSGGLLLPYATYKRQQLKMNSIRIGTCPVAFDARAGGLYKLFARTLVPPGLALVTTLLSIISDPDVIKETFISMFPVIILCALWLVIAWFFYRAGQYRWLCSGISFAGMRLGSTLTGRRFLWIQIGNWVMLLFGYLFVWAWIKIRNIRVKLDSVIFTGSPALYSIMQDTGDAPETGEGMLEAFDIDAGL